MNKATITLTQAKKRTKVSEKGKNLLAMLALVTLFLIASVLTAGPLPSNPSSVNQVSYTMAHDRANHISQER